MYRFVDEIGRKLRMFPICGLVAYGITNTYVLTVLFHICLSLAKQFITKDPDFYNENAIRIWKERIEKTRKTKERAKTRKRSERLLELSNNTVTTNDTSKRTIDYNVLSNKKQRCKDSIDQEDLDNEN